MSSDSFEEKQRSTAPAIVYVTRGIIHDQRIRRKSMSILLVFALLFVVSGMTFLQAVLDPLDHPVWFILFWLTCAWLTLTAMLLAIFDFLVTKLEAQRMRRAPPKT